LSNTTNDEDGFSKLEAFLEAARRATWDALHGPRHLRSGRFRPEEAAIDLEKSRQEPSRCLENPRGTMQSMSIATRLRPVPVDDYLRGETVAERKHEYVEGVVYAMVGASNTHNRLATNVTGLLHAQLREARCEVFNAVAKVRVRLPSGTRFYYPDVSVVCQPNRPEDTFNDAPVVIVEVLSESTRRTDENEKREAYFAIDSLMAYVLVEQDAAAVVVYRRGDAGFAREAYAGIDAVIPLAEIGCELRLSDIYANVAL
jgi:Uma2 family endonuclease